MAIKIDNYLNKIVDVVIDRPIGSKHPDYGFIYQVNYGYILGTHAKDGEEIDAYILGEHTPLKNFRGRVIAIIRRKNDSEDKLVVTNNQCDYKEDEIKALTEFQERFFDMEIICGCSHSLGIRDSRDEFCCFRDIHGSGMCLAWEITSRCNLQCRHCFVKDTNVADLDSKICLRVIKEFPSINVKKVMFTGGEPLLRPDIFDLIKASVNSGANVDIVTNGLLLSNDKIKKLITSRLTEVTISLDGPRLIHDSIRGMQGAFDMVSKSIQRFTDAGLPVDIVCVITRMNLYSLADLVEEVLNLRCSSLTLSGLSGKALSHATFQALALDLEELARLSAEVTELRNRVNTKLPIRTVALFKRPTQRMQCPVKRMMAIDKHGKVKHCLLATDVSGKSLDIQSGLVTTVQKIDRSTRCGLYKWTLRDSGECSSDTIQKR